MDKQKLFEIAITPIVIAVVGALGTLLITQQQTKSAETLSEAQLQSSENQAKANQQIKVLEIFGEKIMGNAQERELALRILGAVDPKLAIEISNAVAETKSIDEDTRKIAREVADEGTKRKLNQEFGIGLYSLQSDEVLTKIANFLSDEGYNIKRKVMVQKKPTWFALSSTVLYYDGRNRVKAENLAKELRQLTDVVFSTEEGAGRGVPEDEREWLLVIHFVPANRENSLE